MKMNSFLCYCRKFDTLLSFVHFTVFIFLRMKICESHTNVKITDQHLYKIDAYFAKQEVVLNAPDLTLNQLVSCTKVPIFSQIVSCWVWFKEVQILRVTIQK